MYGKISFQPGVFPDDSPLDAEGFFVDSDKIRFVRGKPQTIGGWERFTSETFLGIARGLYAWGDRSRNPYLAIGTNLRLNAYDVDGNEYDITPVTSYGTLTNPFTTSSGLTTVSVSHSSHGLVADQKVRFSNASAVGGITINGEYTITSVTDANTYVITHSAAASSSAGPGGGTVLTEIFLAPGQVDGLGGLGYGTGGYGSGTYGSSASGYTYYPRSWSFDNWGANLIANPRAGAIYEWAPNLTQSELVTNGSFTIGTGWSVGSGWTINGSALATISTGTLSQAVTTNSYAWHLLDFDATVTAGSVVATYGGLTIGSATATGNYRLPFFAGYGGSQTLSFVGATFTGSLDNVSVKVKTTAQQISNAPSQVTSTFITAERRVVACGTTDGNNVFDPLAIRWSGLNGDTPDNSVWTVSLETTAGLYILTQGTRIVRGLAGKGENLIFTDTGVYSMRYVPDISQVYRFDLLGTGCGLIGPNAVVQVSGAFFWLTPGGEFYVYDGGVPRPLKSTVRRYVADNLSWVQQDKVYAFPISAWGEVGWLYPDQRDGNECSRYVLYNYLDNVWSLGTFDRTSWIDAGVFQYPIAVDSSGQIWFHEKGFTEDGGARSWSLETGYTNLGDGDSLMSIMGAYPDAEDLQGGYSVTIRTRTNDSRGVFTRTMGPYDITSATGKVSIRAKGRDAKITFSGDDAPTFWRMGAFRFDMKPDKSRR